MKSIAIFYYSMTAQCQAAVDAIVKGLPEGVKAHLVRVEPTEARWRLSVPFTRWFLTFLRTLVPTLGSDAVQIKTSPAEWPACDRVVVGAPTWWARTCLPMQSLLRSRKMQDYLNGKPVGVFAGCRGAYKNNLAEMVEAVEAAGGSVVAREKFTFTGGLVGTFLTFFALLRFGTPQQRWLGMRLPPYGFSDATLERARQFADTVVNAAAAKTAPRVEGAAGSARLETVLRYLYLGLSCFDLALAIAFIFFGQRVISLVAPSEFADPVFFLRCVGLFLLQYAYIQFRAFRDPRAHATCLSMTVAVRLGFPVLYLTEVALWGAPLSGLAWGFVASAVGDLAISVFTLFSMKRLGIGFTTGDSSRSPYAPSVGWLRLLLAVLALAEFAISWNWLLLPGFWLKSFEVAYSVDPFWTRATGLFLLNIAYIQYLAFKDPHRYRSAVITSGLFRALWPALYWYSTAMGEGNGFFRLFIMFFSFFDLTTCIVIFVLLKKTIARSQAPRVVPSG